MTTPVSLKSETDDKPAGYPVQVITPVSLESDTEEKPDTPKDLQMKVVDTKQFYY